jgi:small subunit ribosomal protein S16
MAVKIRLARKGRKQVAFYHIVVADSRSPRDGRYIEKIGTYFPVTNPATIELDFDKALGWLQNGALPTDTCRAILSYKGVLLKKHLLEGVKKGAFDEAEATKRFEAWIKQQETKVETKKSGLKKSADEVTTNRLKAEKKVNDARAEQLAKRHVELAAKEIAVEATETVAETADQNVETEQEIVAEVADQNAETEQEIVAEVPAADDTQEVES